MKLIAFFILAACLHVNATGYGQKVTLSEREVHIEKIFTEIKKQTGFTFLYTSNILANTKRVSVKVTNATVNEVLDIALAGQGLEYRLKDEDRLIIIKTKPQNKTTTSPESAQGGPIDVSGRVTDGEGRPLAGANVKIRGADIGVTTDNNGNFVLKNVSENAVLEISFVGFELKTLTVRGAGFVNIALGQKLAELDEAVVIAYGTTSRRFTTGNIATVKAADIEKQPVQNPLLALQGRVPGIEITQLTGMPGGGVTVRIQGQNSIGSGLDPLIVVDGVPFPIKLEGSGHLEYDLVKHGSPLNYINPADIESIDILKDADATAIYGSRAANGAILITTKKGKAGRVRLNLNLQQGWGKVMRKVKMMNTRQYLDMRYEAYRNSGVVFTNSTVAADDLKVWDTTRYTDWQKELIGSTAKYTNLSISMSGGTPAVQYLVGATYNRQTTVFPGNFDDRAGSLNFNVNSSTANQRLKIQLSGNYRYDQNRLPGIDITQSALLMEPHAPSLYNEDGTLNWAPNVAGRSTWTNPLAYTTSNDFNNITKNLVSNLTLGYRIIKGLELRSSFGYTNLQAQLYSPVRLEYYAPEVRPNSQRVTSFGNRTMSSWIAEPMLHYEGQVNRGKLDVLLGSTIQESSFSYLGIRGLGFDTDLLMKTLAAARAFTIVSSSSGITRYNALFGRLNYNWNNKYLLNLTARRDGSNKFGDKNKFNNFGSIGLGWIVSQEKWISDRLRSLSFCKLRTSYGVTGNDQIAEFSYLSIYSINNPTILYQNGISLEATNIPNPYLQWERTTKWQSGVDLGLFNDRFLLGVTYARNRSSNQLVGYVLPSLTGFQSIVKNLPATIQNTSWEFSLNTVNLKTKNFNWTTSANFTIPRNKLISFPGIELTSYADGTRGVAVGQPLGVVKVHRYAGLNPANGAHLNMDLNNNPAMSFLSLDKYVSAMTYWYGGIINAIGYKGFQLEFLVQYVRKKGTRDFVWHNGATYPGTLSKGFSNQPVTVLNRWQKPGDDKLLPPFYTSTYSNSVFSSDAYYSFDASFIRLKNVSLSWQLPGKWVKKANIQNVLFYLRAQNLALITNYQGIDPESGGASLPPLQMLTAGLNIHF